MGVKRGHGTNRLLIYSQSSSNESCENVVKMNQNVPKCFRSFQDVQKVHSCSKITYHFRKREGLFSYFRMVEIGKFREAVENYIIICFVLFHFSTIFMMF